MKHLVYGALSPVEVAKKLLGSISPTLVKAVTSNEEHGVVLDLDSWATIQTTQIERKTLRGSVMLDGYEVCVSTINHSNDHWTPDDVDEESVLESQDLAACVLKAVEIVTANHFRLMLEGIGATVVNEDELPDGFRVLLAKL